MRPEFAQEGPMKRISAWAEHRAAPVVATTAMLVVVMAYSLLAHPRRHTARHALLAPSDYLSLVNSSSAVLHGRFGLIYGNDTALVSPPALEVVLVPVIALGHLLGLSVSAMWSQGGDTPRTVSRWRCWRGRPWPWIVAARPGRPERRCCSGSPWPFNRWPSSAWYPYWPAWAGAAGRGSGPACSCRVWSCWCRRCSAGPTTQCSCWCTSPWSWPTTPSPR